MADGPEVKEKMDARTSLALAIASVSVIGVLGLSVAVICLNAGDKDTQKSVLSSIVPLLGSWVGTILAFYFTRDSYESANKNAAALVNQISPQQKLASLPVKDKMIPKSGMYYRELPEKKIGLADTITNLEKAQKGARVPVLGSQGQPAYVVHRSTIDRYLASKALEAQPAAPGGPGTVPSPPNLQDLTLADLLADKPELQKQLAGSFAVIKPDVTLAEAKTAMESTPNCQDVFVTDDGTANTSVQGWVTNSIIEQNSKV